MAVRLGKPLTFLRGSGGAGDWLGFGNAGCVSARQCRPGRPGTSSSYGVVGLRVFTEDDVFMAAELGADPYVGLLREAYEDEAARVLVTAIWGGWPRTWWTVSRTRSAPAGDRTRV
jgi:hypothetical protein